MKNLKKLIVLLICVVMLSGCMKSHTTMTIKSDKSMDYEQEVLMAESLTSQMDMSNEFDASEYEKRGFKVTNVSENGYTGFKLTKHFDNIDDMSKNKGEEVTISNFLDDDFNSKVIFKMEKGFFKNTYTAKFKYESMASDYQNSLNGTEDTVDTTSATEDTVTTTEETVTTTQETTTDTTTDETATTESTTTEATTTDTATDDATGETDMSGLEDLMGLAGEMEFTYKLVLPVKAEKSNATKTTDDGKTLTWNLATDKESTIEFTFSLLNMTNIIIVGGGALLLIVIVIVVIIVMKKKKASSDTLIHTDYDPSIAGTVQADPNAPMTANVETAPMGPGPEAAPAVPQTDNLQFNLPTEQTQVNVEPQQPTFITPAVEEAVNTVTESTPTPMPEAPAMAPISEQPVMTPVSEAPTPMPEAPVMTPISEQPVMTPVSETPTVTIPETPTVTIPGDQNNNLM